MMNGNQPFFNRARPQRKCLLPLKRFNFLAMNWPMKAMEVSVDKLLGSTPLAPPLCDHSSHETVAARDHKPSWL